MRVCVLLMVFALSALVSSSAKPHDPSEYRNTTKIDLAAGERDLLAGINRQRREQHLPAYTYSERLWHHIKNHTRRMALEQNLAPMDLKDLSEGRAGSNPISFWAGVSGNVSRVENPESLPQILRRWAQDKEAEAALWSRQYNRAAVAISVDRVGALYVALIAGEEIYQESDLRPLEAKLFESINATRAKKGLHPLQFSEPLNRVARGYSERMALRSYLSHTDLNGQGVVERLRLNGISHWQACAENIASNYGQRDPVQAAINGWLTSPPHAAAILRPDFTHTGIGIFQALDETYYFTQVFIKTP